MGWKYYDEAIDVMQHRGRYFPAVFRWRGRCYQVDAIERSWVVPALRWWRRHDRRFFHARCGEGSFDLYQDLQAGTWHLRRARLGPAPAAMLVLRPVPQRWRS
jgi:hypothetical protein